MRNKLTEDFEDCKVRKAVAECLINSAVFGTGVGEIVIEEMKEMVSNSAYNGWRLAGRRRQHTRKS